MFKRENIENNKQQQTSVAVCMIEENVRTIELGKPDDFCVQRFLNLDIHISLWKHIVGTFLDKKPGESAVQIHLCLMILIVLLWNWIAWPWSTELLWSSVQGRFSVANFVG